MFENTEKRMQRYKEQKEDELLEIFILLENNNYESTKEALIRYMRLTGLNALNAMDEMKEKYKKFTNK